MFCYFGHIKFSLRCLIEDSDQIPLFPCVPLFNASSIIHIRASAREASHGCIYQSSTVFYRWKPVPFVASIFDRQSIYCIRGRHCMTRKLGAESIPTCTKAWNLMPAVVLATPRRWATQNMDIFPTVWLLGSLQIQSHVHNILFQICTHKA